MRRCSSRFKAIFRAQRAIERRVVMKRTTHMKIALLGSGAAALALALVAQDASAAGFQINEHAAPATGRASSVTATIDDPSAIFHNAAGLTNTEGTEFMAGV